MTSPGLVKVNENGNGKEVAERVVTVFCESYECNSKYSSGGREGG